MARRAAATVRRPLARIVPATKTSTWRNVGVVNATANGASSDNGETVASGGVDMGLTSTEPRHHTPRQRLYPVRRHHKRAKVESSFRSEFSVGPPPVGRDAVQARPYLHHRLTWTPRIGPARHDCDPSLWPTKIGYSPIVTIV